MEQYIKKSAVIAEIKKVIDEPAPSHDQQCWWEDGYYCGLYTAESIIDTLEVEEIGVDLGDSKGDKSVEYIIDTETLEMKEVNLNEEFDKYFFNFVNPDTGEKLKREECWLNNRQAKKFAQHFFVLGLFSQLTWKDIRLISEIGEDFMNSEESDDLGEEEYYTMILNKLKEKGRDYKTERQITRELEQKGEEV